MASRLFMVILVALLPGMCLAQSWMPFDALAVPFWGQNKPIGSALSAPCKAGPSWEWPVRISDVQAKPFVARTTLNLRDQVGLSFRGTVGQASVSAELPGWFEGRYTFRPRMRWEETLTPVGALTIGDVTFGKAGGTSEPKPVALDWWTQSHQIDVVGRTSWFVQPYVAARFYQFEVRAQGKDSDGKAVDSTERFERWFPAVGAAFTLPLPKITAEIRAAAWQNFTTVEVSARYSPIPWVTVGAEYQWEQLRVGDMTERTDGIVGTVGIRF